MGKGKAFPSLAWATVCSRPSGVSVLTATTEMPASTKDFVDAGISVVAVSTDTPEGLEHTVAQAKDGKAFPFPIVRDHENGTFRLYREYDDFEHIAMHGPLLA